MTHSIDWTAVTLADVEFAVAEFDRLGAEAFYADSGYRPTTTYDLHLEGRVYPPKAILGVAYTHATGRTLRSADFEGGRDGAVKVLTNLGLDVRART